MTRLLLPLAAGLLLSAQAAPQGPQPGAISGIVIDAITGQPLAGATVSLSRIGTPGAGVAPPTATANPRVVTDSKGRFVYANLTPADDYYLGARMPGYEYTRYGWTAPDQTLAINDILRINVASGQWIADIKIPLWRRPAISGRVVDERGEPVVGVAVRAFSKAMIAGRLQMAGSQLVTTDDRGVYAIPGLPPGRYLVSVLSVQSTVLVTTPEAPMTRAVGELVTGGVGAGGPGMIAAPGIDLDGKHRLALTNFMTPPPPSAAQARTYTAQFYPGVTTAAEATEIELNYRQSQQGIDFQLRPVAAFRVSGRIDGTVAPGLLLRLMPVGSEGLGFGSEAATTVIESDSTFTFFNVPSGQYTLMAQSSLIDFTTGDATVRLPDPPGYSGGGVGVGSRNGVPNMSYLSRSGAAAPSWGRMPVNVGGHIDNLTLVMHPVGKISGRIEFEEGVTAPSNARFFVHAEPANGDPAAGLATAVSSFANNVHSFSVFGLLGATYLVNGDTGGSNPLTTTTVTARGRDVTYTGIDMSAASEVDDVVIMVTNKRQEIRGAVSGAPQGRPVGIIVFPADRALWSNYGWDARLFRTTRAGSNGSFTVRLQAAGDYYIIAVDATKLDAWTDQRFLAVAAPLASRFTLAWGDTKAQDLVWRDVVVK